ncbi:Plant basic secretory protein (BSP) family protein [Euphorbia peplus]|nr:Plant basic secretory protein (BSP) family protein [Euphorbia peplus]
MSKHNAAFILSVLVILATIAGNHAVDYTVTNTATSTAGGARFASEIGEDYSRTIQSAASEFIWMMFQQANVGDRKNVQQVNLFIDDMDGVAYATNNEIHFSANYIGNYSSGDLKTEFTGVIYHEMTHIWQWNGNGQTPGGLIEGIADYIRLKANYVPSHWVKAGEGEKWDQGYDVTARFLEYCDEIRNGFVAEMNQKMMSGYSEQFFVDLLNKSVDEVWSDYKAKYGQ